jgi:predicted TIM-barrel fold metal-dependent hydrolase
LLSQFNLSFDMQLYYQQMEQAARLAMRYERTLIIVNHTGMPVERDKQGIEGWRTGMKALASCPNIVVKISGLGMTDPEWTTESIRPFVLEAIDIFGANRCMFASNFPVASLFSSYDRLFDAYGAIVNDFSAAEQSMLFHDNAERYYRI